jgi:hypothetical protein
MEDDGMRRHSMTYTSGVCAITLVTVYALANDLAVNVSILYYLLVIIILIAQDVRPSVGGYVRTA